MKRYERPKCHAAIWSKKKLDYCTCGGKYPTPLDDFSKYISDFGSGDLSGKVK